MSGMDPKDRQASVGENLTPELDREACLALLASASTARLALSMNALPHIVLADFKLLDLAEDPEIVIRVAEGAKLLDAFRESVVAAEVEHLDAEDRTGWVVLLQGRSRLVADPLQIGLATSAFLTATATPCRFAAIRPDRVHGHLVGSRYPFTPADVHVGLSRPDPGRPAGQTD